MRTLILGMLFCLVSGDKTVSYVKGSEGDHVLLPCNCPNRNPYMPLRWQADGVLVVKHTGDTSDFTGNYKDRAGLFLSENWKSSNCSLLLKNITRKDEGNYTCSFKHSGERHEYWDVKLTVSAVGDAALVGVLTGTHPVPTEPPSPDNLQILWLLIPVALVVVPSMFFLYKRRASRKLNADEEESAEKLNV